MANILRPTRTVAKNGHVLVEEIPRAEWTTEVLLATYTVKEAGQLQARGWRDRRVDEWPPVCADCRPADYAHDLDRGTVAYLPEWRNYSFHRVRIPAQTVIRECNFTQAVPNTTAITVLGAPFRVTFIDCNLGNVRVHPDWILEGCNTVQSWIVVDAEGNEDRQWIARHPDDLPPVVIAPATAVTRRDF